MDFGESFGVFSWLGMAAWGLGNWQALGPRGVWYLSTGELQPTPAKPGSTSVVACSDARLSSNHRQKPCYCIGRLFPSNTMEKGLSTLWGSGARLVPGLM